MLIMLVNDIEELRHFSDNVDEDGGVHLLPRSCTGSIEPEIMSLLSQAQP
jgi:hypothetical protein